VKQQAFVLGLLFIALIAAVASAATSTVVLAVEGMT
jgi:hypothetical protein